jgi:FMN phosphatase YigB (HAD superfamily)
MAIRSISDFYSLSLFIFDLDNTIYNEEDYLFQAYSAIAEKFATETAIHNREQLFRLLMDIYRKDGREKLFNKFLGTSGFNETHLPICLDILRTFKPAHPIELDLNTRHLLLSLKERNKLIFVLTNGNPDQQRNKIGNLNWEGLDRHINFVFANEIEPKPSPAGVFYILEKSGVHMNKTVLIGDSETDKTCAQISGVEYLHIDTLAALAKSF